MKELSIEEKAKRYDEAIEKAKKHYEGCKMRGNDWFVEDMEDIFPELKESKGEKIRKEIISALKFANHKGVYDKHLAWLEKQGEHAKFCDSIQVGDKVTRNQDGVLVNLSQLKRVAKPAEKYNITGIGSKNAQGKLGEMIKNLKPADKIEPKFCIGDVVKRGLSTLRISSINFKKRFYELSTKEGIVVSCVPFSEQDNWELVAKNTTIRPKYCVMSNSPYCPYYNKHQHAWSKEDKERYISCLQRLGTGVPKQPETINSKWFKEHVYPQTTWKPSEKQLEAVRIAAELGTANNSWAMGVLKSMYQDLKKIREG